MAPKLFLCLAILFILTLAEGKAKVTTKTECSREDGKPCDKRPALNATSMDKMTESGLVSQADTYNYPSKGCDNGNNDGNNGNNCDYSDWYYRRVPYGCTTCGKWRAKISGSRKSAYIRSQYCSKNRDQYPKGYDYPKGYVSYFVYADDDCCIYKLKYRISTYKIGIQVYQCCHNNNKNGGD